LFILSDKNFSASWSKYLIYACMANFTLVTHLYDSDVLINTTACSSCFVHFQTLTKEMYSTFKPNIKLSKIHNKQLMINCSRFREM